VPDEEEDHVTLQDDSLQDEVVVAALVHNIDGTNDSEEEDIHLLGSGGTQTAQAAGWGDYI
jgi:hypothetical protein